MPPLVYETVAWLRYYTSLPLPPLPGEGEANVTADPSKNAYAAPLAGALIGAAGALALLFAYALHLRPFAAAAFALTVLAIVTGAMAQRALIVAGDRLGVSGKGAALAYPGLVILIAAVLVHMGAVFGLVQLGVLKAAVALIAAAAVARGTAVSFALSSAKTSPEGGDSSALQKLVLVALAVGIALILPVYGLGSAVAGMAAAIAAAAVVNAFTPRTAEGGERELSGPVEIAAEIAFLIAVYIFAAD
jgi:adenosylcobinamide-GDP ribazoletransferase